MLNKLFKTIKGIVSRLDFIEICFGILATVVFFPWSLIFWTIWIIKHWDDEG